MNGPNNNNNNNNKQCSNSPYQVASGRGRAPGAPRARGGGGRLRHGRLRLPVGRAKVAVVKRARRGARGKVGHQDHRFAVGGIPLCIGRVVAVTAVVVVDALVLHRDRTGRGLMMAGTASAYTPISIQLHAGTPRMMGTSRAPTAAHYVAAMYAL